MKIEDKRIRDLYGAIHYADEDPTLFALMNFFIDLKDGDMLYIISVKPTKKRRKATGKKK